MSRENSGRSWPNSRPKGERRMGANPHANGGILLRDLRMPDFREYAVAGSDARRGECRGYVGVGEVYPGRCAAQSGRETFACLDRTKRCRIA